MANLSNLSDANDLSSPDGLVFSPTTGISGKRPRSATIVITKNGGGVIGS